MNKKTLPKKIEHFFEAILFSSRWLLAPIYLGLGAVIAVISIEFYQEIYQLLLSRSDLSEASLILKALSLIDFSLVGGLTIMIMLSGYEIFVSRLDVYDNCEMPFWLGTLDISSIKLKVAASLVAISSIHLLKKFLNAEMVSNDKLMWYALLHLVFVFSAFMMGILDRMGKSH